MHELSAGTAIVRTVVQACKGKHVRRIKSVNIQIGTLTLLNPEQLDFCFDIAAKDTLAEGAKLEIETTPAVLECVSCGTKFDWKPVDDDPAYYLLGPKLKCDCGSTDIRIAAGREFKVLNMTVEQEESPV